MSNDTESSDFIAIKKVHLMDLKRWLDIPLTPGVMNRSRNEFLRMLQPFSDELETARLEIVKKYAKDGKTVNPEFATPENKEAAEKDYLVLLDEIVRIPNTKPYAVTVVKELLRTSEVKLGNIEGQRFDEVCDILGINFTDVSHETEEKK